MARARGRRLKSRGRRLCVPTAVCAVALSLFPTAAGALPSLKLPRLAPPRLTPPPVTLPPVTLPPVTVPPAKAPPFAAPPLRTPELKTPPVSTPELKTPPVSTPELKVPPIRTPELKVPIRVPVVKTPPISTLESPAPPVTTTPASPGKASSGSADSASANTGKPAQSVAAAATAHGVNGPTVAAKHRANHSRASSRGRSATRSRARRSAGNGPGDPPRAAPAGVAHAAGAGKSRKTVARSAQPPHVGAVKGSATIRTIERLIGVIPLAVWIALAALAGLALALGGSSWLALARARRSERLRRRLAADIGLLQAALLPVVPERVGGVGTSVAYRPADGPAAGGDFYDVFELKDGRLAVILGDVTGHGRTALPKTALIRYTMRAYLDSGMRPRRALAGGAAVLDRQLEGTLATVLLAVYDQRGRTLTYACAGHPPPLVSPGHVDPLLECASPPVGMPPTGLRESTIAIPGRAQVCLFTDGLIEARIGGELFGCERLAGELAKLGESATAPALLRRVVAASDKRPDDMAACVLTFAGAALPPTLVGEELVLTRAAVDWDATERFLLAHGVATERVREALREARHLLEAASAAVLRLRLSDASPELEVASAHAEGPTTDGPALSEAQASLEAG